MRTLLIAVLSSILLVSISAAPVSAQNGNFDGIYEISVSRIFLRGDSSTKKGAKQLMHVAKVEVRGSGVRFLELTTNNARAGRGIVFRGFQGNVNQSGVMSFSTRVSTALYNDEKNNASLLKASVPLKLPAEVGQTVAVTANDLTIKYGAYVSVKTLKLYQPSQSSTVASNTPSTKVNAPQQAAPRNSRNELQSVIQPRLAELGYYTGAIDGIAGPQTDRAIAAFESSVSGQNDGYLDATEIAALVAAAEAKRQTTSVPQASNTNDNVQALQAENERLRLELENARLRQELEAAKQQGQPAPEATADTIAQNSAVPSSTSDNVAGLDPMRANFDGLYKPKGEQFAHWDCSSVGRDGGALEISGNTLTLIEESCTLSDPSRVAGSSEIAYHAQCAVEGTEYEAQVSLRKTDFGVVFSGEGFSAEWQGCEFEELEEITEDNNFGEDASEQLTTTKAEVERVDAEKAGAEQSVQNQLTTEQNLEVRVQAAKEWLAEQRRAEQAGRQRLGKEYYERFKENNDFSGVNQKEALEWLRKSAEQGYAIAQYQLAFVYEKGQGGVESNRETAKRWYEKAASQGFEEAIDRLEAFSIDGPAFKPKRATRYAALLECELPGFHYASVLICLKHSMLSVVSNGVRNDYDKRNYREAGTPFGRHFLVQLPNSFEIMARNSGDNGYRLALRVIKVEPGRRWHGVTDGETVCTDSTKDYGGSVYCSSEQ